MEDFLCNEGTTKKDYFLFLQVEIPKGRYAGHQLTTAVKRGTTPTAPHQFL